MNPGLGSARPQRQVFFLDSPRGPLFCCALEPLGSPRGGVLYVPPLAEEMNKSRHMAALAAQQFARQGWLVLQPDLSGTGDSAGEFAQATWADWLEDLSLAWGWLEQRLSALAGPLPMALWALRAGGLLATQWLEQRSAQLPVALLLWQPVLAGRQWLTQFLRVKLANEMLAEGDAGKLMAELKAALAAGQTVEVAGYGVHAGLTAALEAATLTLRPETLRCAQVFELVGGDRHEPTPALAMAHARWNEAGVPCTLEVVHGPAFWSTLEIEEAPELMAASCRVLEAWA